MRPDVKNFKPTWFLQLFIAVVLLLLIFAPALAQTSAGYDLSWSNISGGGGSSSGGSFALNGIIGQPDTGALSGGDYTLGGGFLGGGEIQENSDFNIFLPLLNK